MQYMASLSIHADEHAILSKCPGRYGVTFSTQWYKHPEVDNYWICSKCYSERIRHTRIAYHFIGFEHSPLPGHRATCDLGNSTAARQHLRQASGDGNIAPLLSFMRTRQSIKTCCGVDGTYGGQGTTWYCTPEIASFVVCEACYIDYIAHSLFASRFQQNPNEHPTTAIWSCDVAADYIGRLLSQTAARNDWHRFVDAANHYITLPKCSTVGVPITSRKWFRPVKPVPLDHVMFCEACFVDLAALTPIASNFIEVTTEVSDAQRNWICDGSIVAVRNCNYIFSNSDTVSAQNFPLWHKTVDQILKQPLCSASITDGEWYTLSDPRYRVRIANDDMDVCKACYLTYGQASEFHDAFQQRHYQTGSTRACDFHPSCGRSQSYFSAWLESLMKGSPHPLTDYACLIAGLQPCQRSVSVAGSQWWGMDEFFFCPSCYKEIAETSYFASQFSWKGQTSPSARCDMYTDNMRRRYLLACQARDLTEFIAYCKEREEWFLVHKKNVEFQTSLRQITQQANLTNLSAAAWGQTMAVKASGVGSQTWTHATNNLMFAHTNMINGARPALKTPTAIRIEAEWKARE